MSIGQLDEEWFGAWATQPQDAALGRPMQLTLVTTIAVARLRSRGCEVRGSVTAQGIVSARAIAGRLRWRGGALYYHLEGEGLCLHARRRLSALGLPIPVTLMQVQLRCEPGATWLHASLRCEIRRGCLRRVSARP